MDGNAQVVEVTPPGLYISLGNRAVICATPGLPRFISVYKRDASSNPWMLTISRLDY